MRFEIDLEIPEDAMTTHGIFMVSYMQADGKVGYAFQVLDESPITAAAGLMDIVKHHIFASHGVGC